MAGAGPARQFCPRGTNEKDLGQLAQDQQRVLIPDNSQASHVFRPHSARPVAYWFVNMSGTEPPLSEQPSRVDDRYSGLMQPQPGSQDLPQTKGPTPHMRTYP